MNGAKHSQRGKSLAAALWLTGIVGLSFFLLTGPCQLAITSADDARAADALWHYIINEENLSQDPKTQDVWLKPGAGTGHWSRPPTVFVSGITGRQKQDSILSTIREFEGSARFRIVKVRFVISQGRTPEDILREEVVELQPSDY